MQDFGEVTHANLKPNHCLNSLTDLHSAKYWSQVDDSNTHTALSTGKYVVNSLTL